MWYQSRANLVWCSFIAIAQQIEALDPTSCVKRSAVLYTSDQSTFTVLSCPSAVTLEPPTTTVFASNFSCPVATSTGTIQDGTFEGNTGFPFQTSDQRATTNGLTANFEVTSQGPFVPYAGSQYLLVTFTQPTSKRDVTPVSGGVFNISQSLLTTQDGAYALSVYAEARSTTGSDPANCTVMLCNGGTCSEPEALTAEWTLQSYAYVKDSSTVDSNAVFSVWCAAPAYVGLDNLAVNRAVAIPSTAPSSTANSQTTITVTSFIYRNATVRTITTTLVSQNLTTSDLIYTTILPASTVTQTAYSPRFQNFTATQTITPTPSTLTLTLPASTELVSGPTNTETTIDIHTSILDQPTLTLTTTLAAQTQTTYVYGPTYTATAVSISSFYTTEIETYTPSPSIETQTLTYTLPAQTGTQTTTLIETDTPSPTTVIQTQTQISTCVPHFCTATAAFTDPGFEDGTGALPYDLYPGDRGCAFDAHVYLYSDAGAQVHSGKYAFGLHNQCNTQLANSSYNPVYGMAQTIPVCPAHRYHFSVWLYLEGFGTSSSDSYEVLWEARRTFYTQIGYGASLNIPPFQWVEYTMDVTAGDTDTSMTLLIDNWGFVTTPGAYFVLFYDDFSVTDLGSPCGDLPPEPTNTYTFDDVRTETDVTSATVTQLVPTTQQVTTTQQLTTTQQVTISPSTITRSTTVTKSTTRTCIQTGSCTTIASATNGGFESGALSPWNVGSGGPCVSSQISSGANGPVYDGNYALDISITCNPIFGDIDINSPLLPVCGSHHYGASWAMYASAADWTGPLTVELNIVRGPTSNGYVPAGSINQLTVPLDAAWHVYSFPNWTAAAGDTGIQYQFHIMTGAGQSTWNSDSAVSIYVDAIQLIDYDLVCF